MRALALPLLLLLSSVTRTDAQDTNLSAIARRSDVVVLARCIETHSHWDEGARVIVTDVTMAVERSLRGRAARTLTLRTLGGRIGALGMGASHAARFAPQTRVIALLRRSRFGSYFVVTSTLAGPFVVSDGPSGPRVAVGGEMMDVEQLADRLGADTE